MAPQKITYNPYPLAPSLRWDSLGGCYLCGVSADELEEEHVIPKVLYKGFDPGKYLKLQSCLLCNDKKCLEDEYFVRHAQLSAFSSESKVGVEAFVRGLQAGNNQSLAQNISSRLTKIDTATYDGKPLLAVDALRLDAKRMREYIITLAKGFMVAHARRLFQWDEYEAKADFHQALQNQTLFNEEPFSTIWRAGTFGESWRKFFTYRGFILPDEVGSIWVMVFYESILGSVTLSKKGVDLYELQRAAHAAELEANNLKISE